MKLREKEKRQKLLEKMKPEQGKILSKKAAAAKLKQLTKEGKTSLLKVRLSYVVLCHLELPR